MPPRAGAAGRFPGTCLGKRQGPRLQPGKGCRPAPPHLRHCAVPPPEPSRQAARPRVAARGRCVGPAPPPLSIGLCCRRAPRLTRSRPPPGPIGRACALAATRRSQGELLQAPRRRQRRLRGRRRERPGFGGEPSPAREPEQCKCEAPRPLTLDSSVSRPPVLHTGIWDGSGTLGSR